MTDTNQKLREALQHAIEDLSSATGFLTSRSRDRQSKTVAALAQLQADIALPTQAEPVEGGEVPCFPINGKVWFRGSTNEWVLELSGVINDTNFTARHTCPPDTKPEDVVDLPNLYPPAIQEQAVARFNWNKGGFEWLVPYSFDKHNMRPLYLAPEHAEAARKAAQEQLYAGRERHAAEVKALQAEIGRLLGSQEQAQQPIAGPLFCDMKTDADKANFFLSGRGYETGVIAKAVQNDVAMAYQRCVNYAKQSQQPQAQRGASDA